MASRGTVSVVVAGVWGFAAIARAPVVWQVWGRWDWWMVVYRRIDANQDYPTFLDELGQELGLGPPRNMLILELSDDELGVLCRYAPERWGAD